MSDFCVLCVYAYTFTYQDDELMYPACLLFLYYRDSLFHLREVHGLERHACYCSSNRYCFYGTGVKDLINIQGAITKLLGCSQILAWETLDHMRIY